MPMTPEEEIAEIKRLREIAEIKSLRSKRGLTSGGDTVVQEMHPDLGAVNRALVKNFGNDDKASVAYLQKEYPGLEVKQSGSGQIIARRPGEKEFRTLDPENGVLESLNPFRAETWRDLADAGTDIATGVGTGVASAAGGIAGAFGSAGIGAVPAAMASGAAAGAGLEGLRQLAGGALGINREANVGDIALSGFAGAASPLLLGTGGQVGKGLFAEGAKALGQKAGARLGVKAIGDETAQTAQRGLLGLGRDTLLKPAATKIGGLMSGTGADALKTLSQRFPQFEQVAKSRTGVIDFLDDTGDVVNQRFKAARDQAWSEFTDAIGDYGDEATVDLGPLKARWQAAIAEAENRAATGTKASRELLDRLTGAYDEVLRHDVVEEIPEVAMKGTGLLDASGNQIMMPASEVSKRTVRKDLDVLSPKHAVELEKKLAELANYERIDSRAMVAGRTRPADTADDKHLMMIAGDLKRTLGQSVEAVLPENAIPAKRRYGKLLELEKDLDVLTGNDRQAFTNLRNADVRSNITNMQQFRRIDDAIGTDLEARAKFAEILDLFGPGRKSFFQGGGWKDRIPAGVAGAALGGYLQRDQGAGGSLQGGFIGGALGGLLGSPGSMRNFIKYGLKAGRGYRQIAPLGTGLGKEVYEENASPWGKLRRPE